jgi:mannose-6-phosphate isomerase-like protein (cupin superfamily)
MTGAGGATVRTVLDTGAGLVRRLAVVPSGVRLEGTAGPGGELWFVIAGTGRLAFGAGGSGPGAAAATAAGRDSGVWLPPGAGYALHADGASELRVDSVVLPAGGADEAGELGADGVALPGGPAGRDREVAGPRIRVLDDCDVEVTGDRRFRVLFGPGRGCDAATQFVGEIPPGRAPEHSHPYDEVVLILDGSGVLHAGGRDSPLAPGSCVHLPPGTPHCLENTGQATLRVLGVFHPGGSPAAKT